MTRERDFWHIRFTAVGDSFRVTGVAQSKRRQSLDTDRRIVLMKSDTFRRGCFISAIVIATLILLTTRVAEQRSVQGQATTPQQTRTVEQAFKNIQVIKNMPASQLQATMQFMAASLGVDCSHCHTPPAMEKDDKPAKQTARRMLVMMNEINKNFDGKTVVNCATCHRGHTRPLGSPPLPALTSPFVSNIPAAHKEELPTVDQILGRYIKAIGAEQALSKIKTRKRTGSVEVAGMRGTFELYDAAPNKSLMIGTLPPPMGSIRQGFDGSMGWVKNQNGVFEARGEGAAQAKLEANFFLDIRLKEQFTKMTVTGRERNGNREFYVIEGTRPDGQVERLLFDVQSGFLVRRAWETATYFGPLSHATDFDNYKKVSGVWLPFLVRRTRGGTRFVLNILEFKLNVPIDDSIFKKPAAPK